MEFRFVDITDNQAGRVYNGGYPFINWFDNKCSTGLIYYKRLTLVVEGQPGVMRFSLPENTIFKFYDPTRIPLVCDYNPIDDKTIRTICKNEYDENSRAGGLSEGHYIPDADILSIVNGFPFEVDSTPEACPNILPISDQTIIDITSGQYTRQTNTQETIRPWERLSGIVHYDLNECMSNEIDIEPYVSNGQSWYNIYIIASTNVEGEYIDDITVGNDGTMIRIGAEFFTDNEFLQINLRNMGVEIPNDISKAIYQTDLFEENPDYVLLNRKWRELLQNYMDVIGNKGSYKSLLNSLKWFEYGPLVALREVWKYNTPDGIRYALRPIRQYLTEETRKELNVLTKTTHFILSQPAWKTFQTSQDFTYVQPREYDYDWDDTDRTAVRWSKDEMRMKMVLLGQFFETYFMPTHLDLWTSAVDDIEFMTPLQLNYGSADIIENLCINDSQDINITATAGTRMQQIGRSAEYGAPISIMATGMGNAATCKVTTDLTGTPETFDMHKGRDGNLTADIIAAMPGTYTATLSLKDTGNSRYIKSISIHVTDNIQPVLGYYRLNRADNSVNPFNAPADEIFSPIPQPDDMDYHLLKYGYTAIIPGIADEDRYLVPVHTVFTGSTDKDIIEKYRTEDGKRLLYYRYRQGKWIQLVPVRPDIDREMLQRIYDEIDLEVHASDSYTQQLFIPAYYELDEIKGETLEDHTIPSEVPVVIIPRLTLSQADGTFQSLPISNSEYYLRQMNVSWEIYSMATRKTAVLGGYRSDQVLSQTSSDMLPRGTGRVTFHWTIDNIDHKITEPLPFIKSRTQQV